MEIKDVLNFDITGISNCTPKDIHDSYTSLECDQDFEIAMIISEAWLLTQPSMPQAGPEWKDCYFAGITVTLWASAQHLGRCDGQVKPGKEYFGRLEEQENPL
ncbi:hypothetical protein DUI87_20414 [Hirundo rustica rustica]|uniref:Uncharacterized protein n=1 Tax=Hirundo rustica rustica TaxID=333673 RepID=A0A3M0JWP8_HIRRU|nr:hypothetical protein DUI87_20414 [Hirundo rustica rustica]